MIIKRINLNQMFIHLNSTWLNYCICNQLWWHSNTRDRAAAVQGHKSSGALQPRVTEQLGGAGKESEGHFNCVLFVLW